MYPADPTRTVKLGDGVDSTVERLLTARDVSKVFGVPLKSTYDLPIPKVRVGQNRIRWRAEDVQQFIERRVDTGGDDG